MATKIKRVPSISIPFFLSLLIAVLLPATTLVAFEIPTTFMASMTPGRWVLLQTSIGISAMHMQVLHDNTVAIFDRTDFGASNLTLPEGRCRDDPSDVALKVDCTAHSVLYNVATNTYRALFIATDTWCSSGSVIPDGTLIQTGGYNDGESKIRTFTPCGSGNLFAAATCDWSELPQMLAIRRWYASNQILPDGRVIVVGGRNAFSYEFVPKAALNDTALFDLSFLQETRDFLEENNLYPFLHLLPDGNLFIFANNRSISFDVKGNRIVREFPVIPGADKRNYPSAGSSVLLPLVLSNNGVNASVQSQPVAAEIMICGGAKPGSYLQALNGGGFNEASRTCGRLRVTDPEPQWAMETMPMPRVMSDMILLPTGDVIILNGASNGTAGWECGANPALTPILYVKDEPDPTRRFVTLTPSTIPRMYHSTAALLPDGRVLVGGSNPHPVYNFSSRPFPTELSLETFMPYYLAPQYAPLRPSVLSVEAGVGGVALYGSRFKINFVVPFFQAERGVYVTMVAPSFTTHSFGMNQRLLVLDVTEIVQMSPFAHAVTVGAPPTPEIAPPGYYVVFVVHAGIPSHGVWVKLQF